MQKLSGIILAAGLSSRMGDFKPLLRINGQTMIQRVICMMRRCGASPIVIVTGHRHKALEAALAEEADVEFVFNPDYATTQQMDSLRLALIALRGRTERVMISPADVPLVCHATAAMLRDTEGDFVRPNWHGQYGHPVFIQAKWMDYLIAYDGPGGLRGAMENSGAPIRSLPVLDRGTVLDNDTPEDFRCLREWITGRQSIPV